MIRTAVVLGFFGLAAAGVWQLAAPFVPLPPALVGMALLLLGLFAGLRSGAESAGRFHKDLIRQNTLLSEQNRELVELNETLLRERSSPREGAPEDAPEGRSQ